MVTETGRLVEHRAAALHQCNEYDLTCSPSDMLEGFRLSWIFLVFIVCDFEVLFGSYY